MSWFKHDNKSGAPLMRDGFTQGGAPLGVPSRPPAGGAAAFGTTAPAVAELSAPLAVGLELSVRYGLGEYVNFMWQHGGYLIRRRRVGALSGTWLRVRSTGMAALHFVLQRRARRSYAFTIDQHGIIRTCRSGVSAGVTLVPWRDVRAIRKYSCGYMLVLARGTLPLPARCLDATQAAALDGYAAIVKAAARTGPAGT